MSLSLVYPWQPRLKHDTFFFLALFVGYRNKTPDNVVILKNAVQVIDALIT